ncbi:hypothetical protein [Streptomyces sp. NPDC006333]|uniref:hypothetical protein n=1 Tax=Streptomyces sp. NPDC006333 TaxID=3156753 RepID=UPI0033BBFAD9
MVLRTEAADHPIDRVRAHGSRDDPPEVTAGGRAFEGGSKPPPAFSPVPSSRVRSRPGSRLLAGGVAHERRTGASRVSGASPPGQVVRA